MRLNFKKISALATSALLTGMTMGFAVAANYPDPFVKGGVADVAIVYGTGEGVSSLDLLQGANIQTDLQKYMSTTSGGSGTSVEGEAYALFTGSSKIYMNSSISSGIGGSSTTTITDSELPTVLVDGDFSGNVNSDFTQTITLYTSSLLKYGQYPADDVDPIVAFDIGEDAASDSVYNMTVTFNPAVNLTHSDSVGESFNAFGKTYTVGAGTTTTKLYLYESSETIELSVGGASPASTTVEVEGETYTVELVSASDTDATIKVTDSTGASQSKTISEDDSKKVQGIDIAVDLADEDTATNRLLAQVTVGANKVMLQSGSNVKVGTDEDSIKGTRVWAAAGTNWGNSTGFTIGVAAADGDEDAIVSGGSFLDPVFGTFKINFASLANDDDRETIKVAPSGTAKASIEFTTHTGDMKSITWYNNDTNAAELADNDVNDDIHVLEMEAVNVSQYVVVGNEDEGYLLELTEVTNDTDGTDDNIVFQDVFSGKDYEVTGITTEGTGTLTIGGKSFSVTYYDASTSSDRYVTLNYPDTGTAGYHVLYPTIQTSKGAKVAFYERTTIDLDDLTSTDVARIYIPDGNGYEYATLAYNGTAAHWTFTPDDGAGSATVLNTSAAVGAAWNIGGLTYRVNGTTANSTVVTLLNEAGVELALPAIVIWEEQDDATSPAYNAIIVNMEGAGTSSAGVGVEKVEYTWGSTFAGSTTFGGIQWETDDDTYSAMDYWGVIATVDKSDTDQYDAEISYPDEQIYAEVYVAEEGASITPGSSGTGTTTPLGEVLVKDTEVSSVSSKNLVVVGGSCINSAAATLVGGAYCGADWTDKTNVGTGEFLIKSYSASTIAPTKVALLVAGYNAADTVNAATYLRNQKPDTSKHYKGTSSTSAELVTTTETA